MAVYSSDVGEPLVRFAWQLSHLFPTFAPPWALPTWPSGSTQLPHLPNAGKRSPQI